MQQPSTLDMPQSSKFCATDSIRGHACCRLSCDCIQNLHSQQSNKWSHQVHAVSSQNATPQLNHHWSKDQNVHLSEWFSPQDFQVELIKLPSQYRKAIVLQIKARVKIFTVVTAWPTLSMCDASLSLCLTGYTITEAKVRHGWVKELTLFTDCMCFLSM